MKRNVTIRKPQWYRMTEFFDGTAKAITNVNNADVLLQGVLYEVDFSCPKCGAKIHLDKIKLREDGTADLSPQLGLCLIPQEAVSNQQGEALRRMIEANLRMPVLLISNNVQMVRLKPIHQAEADRILEGAGKDGEAGKLVAFKSGNRPEEPDSGRGDGTGDSGRPAKDSGPPGAVGRDEGGEGLVAGETVEEGEIGSSEGATGVSEEERHPKG